jgi:hypothetical protein
MMTEDPRTEFILKSLFNCKELGTGLEAKEVEGLLVVFEDVVVDSRERLQKVKRD